MKTEIKPGDYGEPGATQRQYFKQKGKITVSNASDGLRGALRTDHNHLNPLVTFNL